MGYDSGAIKALLPTPLLPTSLVGSVNGGGSGTGAKTAKTATQLPPVKEMCSTTNSDWSREDHPFFSRRSNDLQGGPRTFFSGQRRFGLVAGAIAPTLGLTLLVCWLFQSQDVPQPSQSGSYGVPSDLRHPEMCNITAPLPMMEWNRSWRLSEKLLQDCREKNQRHFWWQWPEDRNYCWSGFKAKCHANLKAHKSWADLQDMAAEAGIAPPRADGSFTPLEEPELCDRPSHGKSRKYLAHERASARDWFRTRVRVYVLNMPEDKERWSMISQRLRALDIQASRVLGVDLRKPNALETAKLAGWVPLTFNFTRAQHTALSKKQSMGSILGTMGCASAHFKAQKQAMDDGIPLALILEDDSFPVDDFIERLWSLVREELPCDWQVASLMSRCPYGKCVSPHLSRVQPDANEPAWRCRQGVNWGFQGVLYRTSTLPQVQKLWRNQVFNEDRPHCADLDVALASISDRVGYYVVPAGQDPGFLNETNHRSARYSINIAWRGKSYKSTTSNPYNLG